MATTRIRIRMHFHLVEIFLLLIPLVSTSGGLTDLKLKEEPSSSPSPSSGSFKSDYLSLRPPLPVKLTKFSFTQKGYIQFLRYITPVPPIGDFTFCIWMRSANLTYSHPLLSYSKHEEERLIRAWITPGGAEARLSLREIEIMKIPVGLKENQWYHICMSWSAKTGHWDFFLNGKLRSHGYNAKARGQILQKDGDIVVGQEYTDFDKGLDDGIEGDVSGFNMVLVSTSTPPKSGQYYGNYGKEQNRRISTSPKLYPKIQGHYITASEPLLLRRRVSKSLGEDSIASVNLTSSSRKKRQTYPSYSYFRIAAPQPRDRFVKHFVPYQYAAPPAQSYQNFQVKYIPQFLPQNVRNINSRVSNEINSHATPKPLGLQLVELSFNCEYGRGAPLKGREVLISWTKTPVRVFGGAVLKTVDPFCYEPYIGKSDL